MVDRFRDQHKIAGSFGAVIVVTLFCLWAAPTARAEQAFPSELPFSVGEKLIYNVEWLWFDAGRVVLNIPDIVNDGDRRLMRFTMRTTSTNVIAKIFHMDDFFESYWDMENRIPKKLVVKIRESHTTKDKVIDFDHAAGQAVVTTDDKESEIKELNPRAQDFLSSGHFTRTWPLIPKTKIRFPVFEDNKNYNAVIKVIKKERIRIMGGLLDTVMIIPKIKYEGAFQSRGTLYVWMTDDEYKIPVRFKMSIVVGTMVATLTSADGVKLNLIPIEKK
ncbi:MAG: DUF3108 domain-containing protein [Nitrospinota bacterium]